MLGATAQSNEPTVNRIRHVTKTTFLPKMSPAFPANGIAAVFTSWYILKTQPDNTNEASNEEVSTGKATDIAVPLIAESSNERLTATKMKYLDT